jgi:methionyl-tRNA synthetase
MPTICLVLCPYAVPCCAGVGVVRLVAAMISPYMPTLTSRIMAQLNLQDDDAQLTDQLIQAAATPQVRA